jgi:tetratricopeptide (TPR) repeat protein
MANDTTEDLRQKAQQALAQGQYQEARQLYRQALGVHGDHPDIHYGLATVCFLLNDLNGAAYHFLEVTRLDELRAGAFINLGAVYNRMEKYDDAIAALRRGIQIDANRAEGYYNLGIVYRHRKELELAIQAYREATRINPRMPDAHYNLANIYFDREQYGLAVTHYHNALELRPNWEKARRGLEVAEARLNPASRKATASEPKGVAKHGAMDPDRMLDPNVHGNALRDLHQDIVEANQHGHKLLAVIQDDVDRSIRELSNCLLFPNNPANDLQGQIHKFDGVMAELQQLQQILKKTLQRAQQHSDQLNKL